MPNDLVVISKDKGIELFNKVSIDELIGLVKTKVSGFKSDTTTKKGRKEIASNAYQVSRSKTLVTKVGEDFSAKIKHGKNRWVEEMDRIRDEVRKPLTDWEQAESARVRGHEEEIAKIRSFGVVVDQFNQPLTAEVLRGRLLALKEIEINEDIYEEFLSAADDGYLFAESCLQKAITDRDKYEADQEELRMLREKDQQKPLLVADEPKQDTSPLVTKETGKEQYVPLEGIESVVETTPLDTTNGGALCRGTIIYPIEHKKAINRTIHAEIIKITGMESDKAKHLVIAIAKGEIPNLAISY